MKHLTATVLALGLATASGHASAQTYFDGNDRYDNNGYSSYQQAPQYDYARVIRVQPVVGGYRNVSNASSPRCYQRSNTYAGGYATDRYSNDPYYNGGYNDRYNDRYYGNDRYGRDDYYDRGYGGTNTGRTVATVIGGIVGAAIGSQVGGGSARYATSAIGSMVGGIAGQRVYENSVRQRQPRTGTVTVCDPMPDDRYYDQYGTSGSGVNAYDVTYEYGGRQYTTRTNYHPGDRIRVLVDVRPQ